MKVVGYLSPVYSHNILPFVIVVYEALTDRAFLRFDKKSGRATALPVLVAPPALTYIYKLIS